MRVQPQRAYAAVRVLVSSYVLVRVRVLRVLCYLRPRLLSYLHGDLTQPPCPLASARDTPTGKYVHSLDKSATWTAPKRSSTSASARAAGP